MTLSCEFYLGVRYLRAKRRQKTVSLNTFISIGGVTVGVAALIATLAVMTGFKEDIREKILGTNAHIVVTDRTNGTMTDYRKRTAEVEKLPHVIAATPFIYNQVLLSSDFNVHGVVVRGIDPVNEARVTDVAKNLVEGKMEDLEKGQSPPGILIGKELAGRLGVFLGDHLNIVSPVGTPGPFGMVPKMRRYRVSGIFDSGMYEYDTTLAYISLAAAQDFFTMGDAVTGIQVKVDDIFTADQIALQIDRALGFPYWARDWMKLNRNLFSALKLEKIVMFIILILVILVASFNIVSTLTMIVVEKNREIAILKAMGATDRGIMRVFMIDGLIIGVVGVLLGVPLGYGVCEVLQSFYTLPGDVYYLSHLPVKIKLWDVLSVSFSAILISFLATLYPSYQAARLLPAEALRYE